MTIMTTGEPSMIDVVSVSVRLKSERSWVVEGVDFTESTVERVKLFCQSFAFIGCNYMHVG